MINSRELSFQSETILDAKMSKIYEILDNHSIPINDQLRIHHNIVEMLNVIERCYGSKIQV